MKAMAVQRIGPVNHRLVTLTTIAVQSTCDRKNHTRKEKSSSVGRTETRTVRLSTRDGSNNSRADNIAAQSLIGDRSNNGRTAKRAARPWTGEQRPRQLPALRPTGEAHLPWRGCSTPTHSHARAKRAATEQCDLLRGAGETTKWCTVCMDAGVGRQGRAEPRSEGIVCVCVSVRVCMCVNM